MRFDRGSWDFPVYQLPSEAGSNPSRSPGYTWASQMVLVVKIPPANAEDVGWIPGLGRSPGEGNGNPLQYSCLGYPLDRGAWQATVHGVTKELDMTQGLNNDDNNNLINILKLLFTC